MSSTRKRKPKRTEPASAATVDTTSAFHTDTPETASSVDSEAKESTPKKAKQSGTTDEANSSSREALRESVRKAIFTEQQRLSQSPVAFVVNIPLPLKDYETTIKQMNDIYNAFDLVKPHPPFKIVFCVNSRKEGAEKLLQNFEEKFRADKTINSTAVSGSSQSTNLHLAAASSSVPSSTPKNIHKYDIVTMPFKDKKIPYGRFRNTLLHSKATDNAIREFMAQGYYPYISIADADTGRRSTYVDGAEYHIFQAIQNRLLQQSDDGAIHLRPYVISGGYRVAQPATAATETAAAGSGPVSDASVSAAVSEAKKEKLPSASDSKADMDEDEIAVDPKKLAEARVASINTDMFIRSKIAQFHSPLAPYSPEPNLFIDGLIVLADNINSTKQIQFGLGAAEFSQLRKNLDEYIKNDIQTQLASMDASDEIIKIYTENNRHPYRHVSILPCFDLTIETDTDRLFKKATYNQQEDKYVYDDESVAQHHKSITANKEAFVYQRHNNKANLTNTYTDIRDLVNETIEASKSNPSIDLVLQLTKIESEIIRQIKGGPKCDVTTENASYPEISVRKRIKTFLSSCRNLNDKKNRTVPNITNPDHLGLSIWKTLVYTYLGQSNIAQYERFCSPHNSGPKLTETEMNLLLSRAEKLRAYTSPSKISLSTMLEKLDIRLAKCKILLAKLDIITNPAQLAIFNEKLNRLIILFKRVDAAIQTPIALGPKAIKPLPESNEEKSEVTPDIIKKVSMYYQNISDLIQNYNMRITKMAASSSTDESTFTTSAASAGSSSQSTNFTIDATKWSNLQEEVSKALAFVFPNEQRASSASTDLHIGSSSSQAPNYIAILDNYRRLQSELDTLIDLINSNPLSQKTILISHQCQALLDKIDNKIAWAEEAIAEQLAPHTVISSSEAKLDASTTSKKPTIIVTPAAAAAAPPSSGSAASAVFYYASMGNLLTVSQPASMSVSSQAVVHLPSAPSFRPAAE